MRYVAWDDLARNEADIIIKNINKNFLLYRTQTNSDLPQLTDDQLNKIFTVAIKPKELNEKHSLLQLFRCFRNKKPQSRACHPKTDLSIESRVVEPLLQAVGRRESAKVGLEGLSINPIVSTAIRRDLLWNKYPKRPATKAKPRVNLFEDKHHRSFLNKSDC